MYGPFQDAKRASMFYSGSEKIDVSFSSGTDTRENADWAVYNSVAPDVQPNHTLDIIQVQVGGHCWAHCVRL